MQMIITHATTRKEKEMYRKRGRNSKKPSKAIFETMYYNPSMTVWEIANFYNVSIHTIYKWAADFRKEKETNE